MNGEGLSLSVEEIPYVMAGWGTLSCRVHREEEVSEAGGEAGGCGVMQAGQLRCGHSEGKEDADSGLALGPGMAAVSDN